MGTKIKDLTGRTFGRLTPRRVERRQRGRHVLTIWYCDCSCGVTNHPVLASDLSAGHTLSCGCLNQERRQAARAAPCSDRARLALSKRREGWTYQEIATLLKVSRQRAKQLADTARAWEHRQ